MITKIVFTTLISLWMVMVMSFAAILAIVEYVHPLPFLWRYFAITGISCFFVAMLGAGIGMIVMVWNDR